MATRTHRPARARPPERDSGRDGYTLTDLGCPDCPGVLAVGRLGNAHHLVFMCRVGHTFSAESLVPVKEEQLENALWAAVELYEEVEQLHGQLAERAGEAGHAEVAGGLLERATRAARHGRQLRAVIEADAPAEADSEVARRAAEHSEGS
jgi:two-component system chemotaxis response regulator CheB